MKRLTLGQFFLIGALAIVAIVASAFAFFVRQSRLEILRAARDQQRASAGDVQEQVSGELRRAERIVEDLDRGMRSGAIGVDEQASLEAQLFLRVTGDPQIAEVAFTRASVVGYKPNGDPDVAAEGIWQVSVYRPSRGPLTSRLTRREGGAFAAFERAHGDRGRFSGAPHQRVADASDPATDDTFVVLASESGRGQTFWSDLHYSELDSALPVPEQRVLVSVQRAAQDAEGRFVGVIRVGLFTDQLDSIVERMSSQPAGSTGARVALLAPAPDHTGLRLVARVKASDRRVEIASDDELRFVSDAPPPEMAALHASPLAMAVDYEAPSAAEGALTVDGRPWLVTLTPLALGKGGTSNWLVAVLAPESRYTAELDRFQREFLLALGGTLGAILAIGAVILLSVRRGLHRITRETTRMRSFDFTPAQGGGSAFRDVNEVMVGLERAKTVMRAMGRYIPIDLVRKLYVTNREPELGGEEHDVSLMFTDIEGFTTLSEKLAPDVLARRLGDYLEAMTTAIEATGGTIDKYIGDAVMAVWNAPSPVPDHPLQACRAALACMAAARALYASPAWAGLPALVTRYGLHRASVLVGHFGAPTRLSYTALGDGVNLAARLEPLCKQYGVIALVSEQVAQDAQEEFVFRRVDRVAVKGKTTGIDVYELLGAKGDPIANLAPARRYEQAFDAYLARDFEGAVGILEPQAESDPPSAVLLARCRQLRDEPPAEGWQGVHVASSK